MDSKSKKISFLGIATSVALILAYVEVLLPPIFVAIPGIKLGLPNIAIIFVLFKYGVWNAAIVSFVRIVIVSLLFGNPMTFAYSVAGALLSLFVMAVLKKLGIFSIVGISVSGGVFHNMGQILTAMILLRTAELGYYMVVLAFTGTLSGIFVGLCSGLLLRHLMTKK